MSLLIELIFKKLSYLNSFLLIIFTIFALISFYNKCNSWFKKSYNINEEYRKTLDFSDGDKPGFVNKKECFSIKDSGDAPLFESACEEKSLFKKYSDKLTTDTQDSESQTESNIELFDRRFSNSSKLDLDKKISYHFRELDRNCSNILKRNLNLSELGRQVYYSTLKELQEKYKLGIKQ